MKCVIFGGGGFLGSHLALKLLEAGHAVRAFDRTNAAAVRNFPRRGEIEWQRGDFLDPAATARAIAGCDAVFHLAWTTLPKSSNEDPASDVAANVAGTLRLLDAWRAAGTGKVVFASSGGTVYGIPRALPIAEDHPTDPISSYGITKLAIEKYLELYRVLHGVDYCVLRIANPYGERQRIEAGQGAVTTFLQHAHRGEAIEIWGDGRIVRDYVYVGDAADALARTLEYRGEHRIINVGSGTGRDLNEVIAAIEGVTGRPVARRYLPGRRFDVPANVLDIRLARAELGWRPATSFEAGLTRTLRWIAGA